MREEIFAPMASKIFQICVKVGDTVAEDDLLLKLDAMKMEIPVIATVDGVVKEIRVKVNDEVESDEVLMILE
jgi:biotin carboxyl carrier protein